MKISTDYYPFGKPLPGRNYTSSTLTNRRGYQGQFSELDAETGLNFFELRSYDAEVGRFTTFDPYNQFHSPYLGMGNNPVMMIDRDGGGATGGIGAYAGHARPAIGAAAKVGGSGFWKSIATGIGKSAALGAARGSKNGPGGRPITHSDWADGADPFHVRDMQRLFKDGDDWIDKLIPRQEADSNPYRNDLEDDGKGKGIPGWDPFEGWNFPWDDWSNDKTILKPTDTDKIPKKQSDNANGPEPNPEVETESRTDTVENAWGEKYYYHNDTLSTVKKP